MKQEPVPVFAMGKQKTEPHLLMKFRFKGQNNVS